MTEVETDLFDLGICGDVLGVIVAFWDRDWAPKNVTLFYLTLG